MNVDAVKYELGEIVYHVTSGDKGIVTGIFFRPGYVLYCVTWPDRQEGHHLDMELTREKSFEAAEGGMVEG